MRLAMMTAGLIGLAACATTAPNEETAWEEIGRVTDATWLGNGRLKVSSDRPLFMGTERLEYALLTRAAGEAVRRGSDRFVIVEADYDQALDVFGAELEPIGRATIGSYEDLIEARERETEGVGRITSVTYVVRFLEEGDLLRESFSAEETYGALIDNWMNGTD